MATLIWIASIPFSATALAETRIALVVGNEDYPDAIGRLENPHEDAELVAGALEGIGFALVTGGVVLDADRSQLGTAILEFQSALAAAGDEAVGFFYYSGHGASNEVPGQRRRNYLIPARSPATNANQLPLEGIDLGQVIDSLASTRAKAIFVVSDACRNTLPWTSEKGGAPRDRGFVPEFRRAGLFIAYATADGATAPDDGKFARALAGKLSTPGVYAPRAFELAVRELDRPIDRSPVMTYQLPKDICFVTCPGDPGKPDPLLSALTVWNGIKETESIAVLLDFAKQFRETPYASLALARVEELRTITPVLVEPSPPVLPLPRPRPGLVAQAGGDDEPKPSRVADMVRSKGVLPCAIVQSAEGFAQMNPDVWTGIGWEGFDIEICRAVASAVLGDANAVEVVPVGQGDDLLLASHAVLVAGVSENTGVPLVATTFFDGVAVMSSNRVIDDRNKTDFGSGCVVSGSNTEAAVQTYFLEKGWTWKPIPAETQNSAFSVYQDGGCDFIAARMSTLGMQYAVVEDRDRDVILPELLTVVRRGPAVFPSADDDWREIVAVVVDALLLAEDAWITQEYLMLPEDERDPIVWPSDIQTRSASLGLEPGWAERLIWQVGDYGDIYPSFSPRGPNALPRDGGMFVLSDVLSEPVLVQGTFDDDPLTVPNGSGSPRSQKSDDN